MLDKPHPEYSEERLAEYTDNWKSSKLGVNFVHFQIQDANSTFKPFTNEEKKTIYERLRKIDAEHGPIIALSASKGIC